MMDAKVIKTREAYDAAVTEVEALWGAAEGTDGGDRLDLLLLLVEDHEKRHAKPIHADPVALLKAHMEMTGRTQKDLAELIGSDPRASEILRRKRKLSKDHIHKLVQAWQISADQLVAPYALDPA